MTGAVDQRGLVELLRDRLEIPDHDPGAERHRQRRIDQHHAPIGIEQADRFDDLEHRDEQQRVRHQISEENAGGEHARAPEFHAAERKGRQNADHHGDRHHADGDDRGVLEKDQEVGLPQQYPELVERNPVEYEPRIGRHARHFGVALERRDDHVIRRQQEEDREHDQEDTGHDQSPAAIAPETGANTDPLGGWSYGGERTHPISLPRLRTPRRMNTAAMARIGTMSKLAKVTMSENSTVMAMMLCIIGSVMCMNFCQALAPSISAAS